MATLGAKAEADLEKKRIPLRITVMGPGESGKTSLINAVVNNYVQERYPSTESLELYYAAFASQAEEGSNFKFKTLLELEDTPPFEGLDNRTVGQLIDPFWPKPEDVAMKNPPKDEYDGNKLKQSVNVPFSHCKPPTGMFNDECNQVSKGQSQTNPHLYFCGKLDVKDRMCGPRKAGDDFQCWSCRRFQRCLRASGQYQPMVRRRMIYLFIYDANDDKSYFKVHDLYKVFMEECEKKMLKQRPLVYIVGNKIDVDPQRDTFMNIQTHVKEFARQEVEAGRHVTVETVSALRNQKVRKLLAQVVQDCKAREPLWKMTPSGEGGAMHLTEAGCCLQ